MSGDLRVFKAKWQNLLRFTDNGTPPVFAGPPRKQWPGCAEEWLARDLGISLGAVFDDEVAYDGDIMGGGARDHEVLRHAAR